MWNAKDFGDNSGWTAEDFTRKKPDTTPRFTETFSYNDLGITPPEEEKPNNSVLDAAKQGFMGTIKGIGKVLSLPQDLATNIPKFAYDVAHKEAPQWKPNYSYADYLKDVGPVDTDKIQNPIVHNFTESSLNVLGDPLTYIGGGVADDVIKARNATNNIDKVAEIGQKAAKGIKGVSEETPTKVWELPAPAENVHTGADFYTNPYGVTDTKPVEQFLLESPKPKYDLGDYKDLTVNDYDNLLNEANTERQKLIDDQYNYLKNNMSKGVEQGSLFRDESGNVVGRQGRISKNDAWYRQFYQDNGRKPTNAELKTLAENQLKNGFVDDIAGEIPANDAFNSADNYINQITDLRSKALENEKPFILSENNRDVLQPRPYIQRPNYESTKGSKEYVYSQAPTSPIEPLNNIGNKISQPIPESSYKIMSEGTGFTPKTEKINISPKLAQDEAAFTNQDLLHDLELPETNIKIVSSDSVKTPLKDKINNGFSTAYRRFVDNYSPIKKADEDTYIKAINSKNVGGTADYIYKEGLADTNGKTVGKSLKEVAESIPGGTDNKNFWYYMLHKNNVGRAEQGKNIFPEYNSAQSAAKALQIEAQHPEYKQAAQNVRNFLDTFMEKWGKDTGLVSEDTWNNLKQMYPDYIPTNRSFDEIEKNVVNFGKRGFVDQTSPLKKATGSERDIINPLENIMNLVNRTVRTAKYNEVGQSLLDSIRKAPDKLRGLAEEIPTTDGMFSNTDNIVTVMENGKPTYLQINDKPLLDAMKGMYNSSTGDIERVAKKATGVFKSLITQKNPFFAVRNIARDIPTAYVYGSEKNPVKFGADLLSAGKDLVTNSDIAQQYHALGGGGSNFFNAGNVAQSAKELTNNNPLKKIGEGIELFNNITESAPRLAEFKRVFQQTGDANKALYAASDVTTNFARGGDIAKKIDSVVPYMNAGIQGLDKLARSLDPRNPKQMLGTLIKGGIGITAPTAFFHYLNKDNPNYEQLDNRTKDNYYLIPNGDTFIKIPKSRELGVLFGSLFERLYRQANGDSNAWKGYGNTVATNFSPSNPIENNILSPLVYNLPSNKDFAGRAIVPQSMQDLSPRNQYDEKTSEIAKKIGDMTNLSPKQIDYLIKSYTGVIGQVGIPATTKNGDPLKTITTQFTADPAYSNQAVTDFYDNFDRLKTAAADKNFTEQLPSKLITPEERQRNNFTKASEQIGKLNKSLRAVQQSNEANKEEKMRQLREQIINIASKANNSLK